MEILTNKQVEIIDHMDSEINKLNYLMVLLIRYDSEPDAVINTLSSTNEELYPGIGEKFKTPQDGLDGPVTRDKAIIIGKKILVNLVKETITNIRDIVKQYNDNDQLIVVKSNLKLLEEFILEILPITGNKNMLLNNKAAQEYARNKIDKYVTKYVSNDKHTSAVWLNNLYLTIKNTTGMNYDNSEEANLLKISEDVYKKILANIKENVNTEIPMIDKTTLLKINEDIDLTLYNEIGHYVKITNTSDTDMVNTLIMIFDELTKVQHNLNNVNILSYDFNMVNIVLDSLDSLATNIGIGDLTTKEMTYMYEEISKVLRYSRNNLVEHYNRYISLLVNYNNDINLAYLTNEFVSKLMVGATIKE